MRIAIFGSHSTGKTTLTNALSKKFEIPTIDDVVSNIVKNKFKKNNRPQDVKYQRDLDRLLKKYLKKNKIKHKTITGGIKERVNKIAKIIRLQKHDTD